MLNITAQGSYAYHHKSAGNLGTQILDLLYMRRDVPVETVVDMLETNPWSHESILLTCLELYAQGLIKGTMGEPVYK